jgi:5'-3' exonuclease
MGISYIDADTEAEHYCSKLNKLGLVNGVVSEDMDTLACGSSIVLRNFSNRDDMIDEYNLTTILTEMNINYNSFVDMCILLGNDYIPRIRGYTPDDIYNDILNYENIETIIENKSIKLIGDIDRMREIYNTKKIEIDIDNFNNMKPITNLIELSSFLRQNSSIDYETIQNRIHKMYHSFTLNTPINRTYGYWR